MAQPKIPVFRSFRGPTGKPTEAWAMRTLGPEEKEPARRLANLLDEVASGVETVRATQGLAATAEGLRGARKGLLVSVPPKFPLPQDATVACAHGLSLGVELILEPNPPGAAGTPVTDTPAENWMRWQVALPVSDRFDWEAAQKLMEGFDLFPLKFVSASHLDKPAPYGEGALQAAVAVPPGRNVSFVVSPAARWTEGDHLLIALVGSRQDPYWVVAATLGPEALANADVLHRVDKLTQTLVREHGAWGGWLHPLASAAWDNVPAPTCWDVGRRDRTDVPVTTRDDGWQRIDLETRPTHEHVGLTGVPLTAAAMMWLGPAQLAAIDAAKLDAFRACEANHAFDGGGRLVVLTDPIHMPEDTVARQWEFRKQVGIEEAAVRLAQPATAVAAAAVSGLAAEEARRRIELSRMQPGAAAPAATARKVSFGGGEASVDAALKLRFAIRECKLQDGTLVAKDTNGIDRQLSFTSIGGVFARQLPADPPFERALFVDLVPSAPPGVPVSPLRLMAASRVNYASLPWGAATTAMENLRRLARAAAAANPAAAVDAETKAFIDGKPPASFGGLGQFASYDARFAG